MSRLFLAAALLAFSCGREPLSDLLKSARLLVVVPAPIDTLSRRPGSAPASICALRLRDSIGGVAYQLQRSRATSAPAGTTPPWRHEGDYLQLTANARHATSLVRVDCATYAVVAVVPAR